MIYSLCGMRTRTKNWTHAMVHRRLVLGKQWTQLDSHCLPPRGLLTGGGFCWQPGRQDGSLCYRALSWVLPFPTFLHLLLFLEDRMLMERRGKFGDQSQCWGLSKPSQWSNDSRNTRLEEIHRPVLSSSVWEVWSYFKNSLTVGNLNSISVGNRRKTLIFFG